MKTKLTLLTVLAAALFAGGCASTSEPTLTPSRNVLVNVGDRNKTFVNFRLVGNLAIVENATAGLGNEKMIGMSVPFLPTFAAGRDTHILRIPGWLTTWTFKPDGTAIVYEIGGGGEVGPAVQVQGKTLEWPENLVDAKTGEKKPGPQTRKLLVNVGGIVRKLSITGNQATRPDGSTGTFLDYKEGYYHLYLPSWTSDWTFFPDGTAALKEKPWRSGQNFAIPVEGDTVEWPK